jgi:hypothetical protein
MSQTTPLLGQTDHCGGDFGKLLGRAQRSVIDWAWAWAWDIRLPASLAFPATPERMAPLAKTQVRSKALGIDATNA